MRSGNRRRACRDFRFTDEEQPSVSSVTDVDVGAYLAARGRLVDDALEAALPAADRPPQILHQAMRYCVLGGGKRLDRKSTRLNSSHTVISYAVFCLKK